MKFKCLLIGLFIISLTSMVSAQETNTFHQEYKNWKSNALTDQYELTDFLFFMAKAKRNDSASATVKLGFAGINRPYEISVKPLKYEKNENGKLIQTKAFEETKMSMVGIPDKKDFHTPTIILVADSEANAIEISLKFGESNPKIILNLNDKNESVGILTSPR